MSGPERTLSWLDPVGGGDVDGDNLGSGARVFKNKSSGVLHHRTVKASDGTVIITEGSDEIGIRVDPSATGNVADDIAKHGGSTINRVKGVLGYHLQKEDGTDFVEGTDEPELGSSLIFNTQGDVEKYRLDHGTPKGWVDFRLYGALPSTATENDCTDAIIAAMEAAGGIANNTNGRCGTVYIPRAPDGKHWHFDGKITDVMGSMPHIEIKRGVRILGVGGAGAYRSGSRVHLGELCAGFVFVGAQQSSDGGDAAGATVEGLAVFCTPLASTSIVRGWKSNHAYVKGDLIRPHRFHNLYYECLKNGTSTGPTPSIGDCSKYAVDAIFNGPTGEVGNRWRPGKEYDVGDKIYPNTLCGGIFRCTVAGRTIGQNYGNGEAISEITLEPGVDFQPNVGEPDWFTDDIDPAGSLRATITEVNTGGLTWVLDSEEDPEPVWQVEGDRPCLADFFKPNHLYTNGAWVFGEDLDRIFVAKLADPAVPQMSGASPPAGWSTAKYPQEDGYVAGDDIVVAGDITWYCIYPTGIVQDNETVWAARCAGAYQMFAGQVHVKNPYIEGAPASAIGCFSSVANPQFLLSDFACVQGPGQLAANGVGIYARGGDSSGCRFKDILLNGAEADFWGDPADHCIDDASFLGNHYDNISVQGCSGWALATRGTGQSGTIRSLYLEGFGRRSPVGGQTQILGAGTVTQNAFRLGSVHNNSALSKGAGMAFADAMVNVQTQTQSDQDPRMWIRAYLSGTRDGCYAMHADNQVTPGTADDSLGIDYRYNIYPGWWTKMQGGSYPIFSIGGLNAFGVGKGHFWSNRGFWLGQVYRYFAFAGEDEYADNFTRLGYRARGDQYQDFRVCARGRYLKRVVVESDDNALGGKRWQAGMPVSVGQIIQPSEGHQTPNHRAFVVTTGGTTGGTTEPTWSDTLTDVVNDTGGSAVVYETVLGVDVAFSELVEDGITGRTIQKRVRWKDSEDTDSRYAVPKTETWSERDRANTTATTADQVIALLPWTDIPPTNKTHVFQLDVFLIGSRSHPTEAGSGQTFSQKLSATYRLAEDGTWELQATFEGTDDVDYSDAKGAFKPTAWGLAPDEDGINVIVTPDNATSTDWSTVMQATILLDGTFPPPL